MTDARWTTDDIAETARYYGVDEERALRILRGDEYPPGSIGAELQRIGDEMDGLTGASGTGARLLQEHRERQKPHLAAALDRFGLRDAARRVRDTIRRR